MVDVPTFKHGDGKRRIANNRRNSERRDVEGRGGGGGGGEKKWETRGHRPDRGIHRLAVIAIAPRVLIVTLTVASSPLRLNFVAYTTWPSLQRGRAKITGLFRRAATLERLHIAG